jgi:hypothetical protein
MAGRYQRTLMSFGHHAQGHHFCFSRARRCGSSMPLRDPDNYRDYTAPLNRLTFCRTFTNFDETKQSLPEAQNKNGGHSGPLAATI